MDWGRTLRWGETRPGSVADADPCGPPNQTCSPLPFPPKDRATTQEAGPAKLAPSPPYPMARQRQGPCAKGERDRDEGRWRRIKNEKQREKARDTQEMETKRSWHKQDLGRDRRVGVGAGVGWDLGGAHFGWDGMGSDGPDCAEGSINVSPDLLLWVLERVGPASTCSSSSINFFYYYFILNKCQFLNK